MRTELRTSDVARVAAFDHVRFESICEATGLSQAETCDVVAWSTATSYLDGAVTWQVGDDAMTHLFDWAYRDGGPGLSDFAWLVYSAFVIGESRHAGQPADSGSEYFSIPLLRLAIGKSPSSISAQSH